MSDLVKYRGPTLVADMEIANGAYQLIELLGKGGFAWVWKAYNRTLKREVALKFFINGTREQIEQLVKEEGPKLAALRDKQIEGWEHIVIVHSCVLSDGQLPAFLELELMPGSLRRHLGRGPLRDDEALRVAVQIGSALKCAHRQGVVHCDLKPDNILCDEDRRLFKLTDFGLAFKLHDDRRRGGGTPRYMSPEQFEPDRNKVGPPADIYALGCVLYECIEGRTPFVVEERVPVDQRWEHYRALHRDEHPERPAMPASEEFKDLVMRCLSKDVADRPSASDLLQELQAPGRLSPATSVAAPRIERLTLFDDPDYPGGTVVNGDLDLWFQQEPGAGTAFFPRRLITQADYLKFAHDPHHTRWNPQAVRLDSHDGGYLPEWIQGRPRRDRELVPVTSMPCKAAEEFCRWLGGELPELGTLRNFFDVAPPTHPLVQMLRELQARENLPFLQLWCRDDRPTGSREGVLFRFGLPVGDSRAAELRRLLQRVERPKHYCFRDYLFLPIIPEEYATLIKSQRARPLNGDTYSSSTQTSRTFQQRGETPGV